MFTNPSLIACLIISANLSSSKGSLQSSFPTCLRDHEKIWEHAPLDVHPHSDLRQSTQHQPIQYDPRECPKTQVIDAYPYGGSVPINPCCIGGTSGCSTPFLCPLASFLCSWFSATLIAPIPYLDCHYLLLQPVRLA